MLATHKRTDIILIASPAHCTCVGEAR